MKTKITLLFSLIFCLTANAQIITVPGSTFGTLTPITIAYSGASGVNGSWIGLYRATGGDGEYITYQYINESKAGSLDFGGREETGLFNFRLFRGGGYEKIGTSATFMIRQGMLPDVTFQDNGVFRKQALAGFQDIWATAVRVIPNDQIVVAGNIRTGLTDPSGYAKNAFIAARFLANGNPDPEFGDNGFAYATFPELYYSAFYVSAIEAKAMVVQEDRKIIVGGNGMIYGTGFYIQTVIMVRFNANGTIDNTFGSKGVVIDNYKWPQEGDTYAWDDLRCLEVDPQGRILAGGGSLLDRPYSPGRPFIGRYLTDGTSDGTFGGSGILTPGDSIIFRGYVESIIPPVPGGDGTILAGLTDVVQFGSNFSILYKIQNNANYVSGFGHTGIRVEYRPGIINDQSLKSIKIAPNGNLIMMGGNGTWSTWLAAKNPATGADVTTFGNKGVTSYDPTYSNDVPCGMVITADNGIVVGTSTMSYRWSVARFNPNGSIKTDFGTSFYMLMNNGSNVESFVSGIAMLSNGKYILVGGSKYPGTDNWDLMMLRFIDNPEKLSGIDDNPALSCGLSQNYPNPFSQVTTISWNQDLDSHISLNIYDILGKRVAELVNQKLPAGQHQLDFNPLQAGQDRLSAGTYFYQIRIKPIGTEGPGFVQTRKMTILPEN